MQGQNEIKRRNLLYNPNLKEKARKLRNEMTEPEKRLWNNCLRKFKYRVARQKPIGDYIVDFYCAKLNLVIEVDGESHYVKKGIVKDEKRTEYLNSLGLKVFRFTNDDIMKNIEGAGEVINGLVKNKTP